MEALTDSEARSLSKCFCEVELAHGKVLFQEGEPVTCIYIVKSGTCEIYSERNPLKTDEHMFKEMPMTGRQVCLGLDQGSMSSAFNYYPIAQVFVGTWLGIEACFKEDHKLEYSVRGVTAVKLLKATIKEFKVKAPRSLLEHLSLIAKMQAHRLTVRRQKIEQVAIKHKTSEDMHDFHHRAVDAAIKSHPHVSKRILTQLVNQWQLEGTVRAARQKDAVDLGQIVEVEPVAVDVPLKNTKKFSDSERAAINAIILRKQKPILHRKISAQALSPSGRQIAQEKEARQELIDRKLDALEEASLQRMPRHMNKHLLSPSASASLLHSNKKRKQLLTDETRRSLMRLFGVQNNEASMLSLATNQPGLKRSQVEKMQYEPTDAQVQELKSMLDKIVRVDPIKKMRENSQIHIDSDKSHRRKEQAIKGITFFNGEKARVEQELKSAEYQVFRLSDSNERINSLKIEDSGYNELSDAALTLQASFKDIDDFLLGKAAHLQHASSKQLIKSTLMSEQSQRIQVKPEATQYLNTQGPGLVSEMSVKSLLQPAVYRSNVQLIKPASQVRLSFAGPDRSINHGRNSPTSRKTSLRQSFLYKSVKVNLKKGKDKGSSTRNNSLEVRQSRLSSLKRSLLFAPPSATKPAVSNFDQQIRPSVASIPLLNVKQADSRANRFQHNLSIESLQHMNDIATQESADDQRVRVEHRRPHQKRLSVNNLNLPGQNDAATIQMSLEQQRLQFEQFKAQERAMNKLEYEMLRDIRESCPEVEDPRLNLITPEVRQRDNVQKAAAKELEQLDDRYLEPVKFRKATQKVTKTLLGKDSSVAQFLVTETELNGDLKSMAREDVSVRLLRHEAGEEGLKKRKSPAQVDNQEGYTTQPQVTSRSDGVSSSSHGSVLAAIERTVSMYSDHNSKESQQKMLKTQQSQYINEASQAVKEMLNSNGMDLVKAVKAGPFQIKKLNNLEMPQNRFFSSQREISPMGYYIPTRKKSSKSPTIQANLHGHVNHLRYSNTSLDIDRAMFENSIHSHVSNTGMQIVQMNLYDQSPQARDKQKSASLHHCHQHQAGNKKAHRKKSDQSMKQQMTAMALTEKQNNRPSPSPHDLKAEEERKRAKLGDLAESQDMNFKRKRQQQKAADEGKLEDQNDLVQIDLTAKMRNTIQFKEDTSSGKNKTLFPQIIFEDESIRRRVQGTAVGRNNSSGYRQEEVLYAAENNVQGSEVSIGGGPESVGTKYGTQYRKLTKDSQLNRKSKASRSQSMHKKTRKKAKKVPVAATGEEPADNRRSESQEDEAHENTFLPPVLNEQGSKHEYLQILEASKGTKMLVGGASSQEGVESDRILGREQDLQSTNPVSPKVTGLTKIKIAIEKNKNNQVRNLDDSFESKTMVRKTVDLKMSQQQLNMRSSVRGVLRREPLTRSPDDEPRASHKQLRQYQTLQVSPVRGHEYKQLNEQIREMRSNSNQNDDDDEELNITRQSKSVLVQMSEIENKQSGQINKSDAETNSIMVSNKNLKMGDLARQRFELTVNSQLESAGGKGNTLTGGKSFMFGSVGRVTESPWLKRMPVSVNKSVSRKPSVKNLTHQLDKHLVLTSQVENQPLESVVSKLQNSSSVFKESNYIRNQRRTRESHKILKATQARPQDMKMVMYGQFGSKRRSLILDDSQDSSMLFLRDENDARARSNNRPDASYDQSLTSLPRLQEEEKQLRYAKLVEKKKSIEIVGGVNKARSSHPAEQVRMRFQQIKEEKRRKQQI